MELRRLAQVDPRATAERRDRLATPRGEPDRVVGSVQEATTHARPVRARPSTRVAEVNAPLDLQMADFG